MNPLRKRRLLFVCTLCIASLICAYLVIQALRQQLNFFFTPTQIAQKEAKPGTRIRVGGMVEKGSVVKGGGLFVQFILTDFKHQVPIHYTGILPDLFKEEQGIVALGRLHETAGTPVFLADEVLAKHDENYMPKEVRDALQAK